MAILVGSSRRFSCAFKVSGTPTNPTTTTAVVKGPDGVETSYVYGTDVEVVRLSTGNFYIDVTLDAAGPWSVLWVATGAVVAVDRSAVQVVATGFTAS